ncbi:LamG-like jellyroll fold domain-containing protein [Rubellicoccus peritrichatus]|uniref:LamG-like jellyroll fold domain-containing protein n=1 Tax=Rubellicoccus peritrichatus TaxID=3080537 RepID=A0AAQ3LDH1_9BACT|nr:LamG-like jellyroll fold domain-containing protein [Puniceicoccus sp. CR14]WOO40054.1 LamG-like jellyroll fold domain-containing protein [Puniceicoccus sp. CR14]
MSNTNLYTKSAISFLGAILASSIATLNAADIGYWQFEGTSGQAVVTVDSQVNNSSFTSAIVNGFGGAGSTAPTYSSNVVTGPGEVITSGVGGPIVNSNNTTSIQFVQDSSSVGQMLQINDGATGLFEPSGAFTIEAFVIGGNDIFGAVINKEQFATTSSAGFFTDFTSSRVRIWGDGDRTDPIDTNPNGISDGNWHHTAIVYDGAGTVSMYFDYSLLGTLAADPTAGWQANGPLSIAGLTGNVSGSSLFSGLVDELRFSDTALATNEFLVVAIPEPSAYAFFVGAVAIAGSCYMRKKRTR